MKDKDNKEEKFLLEAYVEAGTQVRNTNTIRNTYLGFFMVAIAAFLGLLSRQEQAVDKTIWFVFSTFAFVGAAVFGFTLQYIKRSLDRQRKIAEYLLPCEKTRKALGFKTPDYVCNKVWGTRLDWGPILAFLAATGFGVYCALYGDPFRLVDKGTHEWRCWHLIFGCIVFLVLVGVVALACWAEKNAKEYQRERVQRSKSTTEV